MRQYLNFHFLFLDYLLMLIIFQLAALDHSITHFIAMSQKNLL